MRLSKNWLTEGLIDFEYKQYLLLAFLKYTKAKFDQEELYPALGELMTHHQSLVNFQYQKTSSEHQLRKGLTSIDFKKMKLMYGDVDSKSDEIQQIEKIVQFSIPKIEQQIETGKQLYDQVEANMNIYPIGVQPTCIDSGIVFLKRKKARSVRIYDYSIKSFYQMGEKYKGLHLRFIKEKTYSLTETLEKLKLQMIQKRVEYTLPATYLIEHGLSGSYFNTTFPIAKRLLIKHIHSKDR